MTQTHMLESAILLKPTPELVFSSPLCPSQRQSEWEKRPFLKLTSPDKAHETEQGLKHSLELPVRDGKTMKGAESGLEVSRPILPLQKRPSWRRLHILVFFQTFVYALTEKNQSAAFQRETNIRSAGEVATVAAVAAAAYVPNSQLPPAGNL